MYVVIHFTKDRRVIQVYGPVTSEVAGIVWRGLPLVNDETREIVVLTKLEA